MLGRLVNPASYVQRQVRALHATEPLPQRKVSCTCAPIPRGAHHRLPCTFELAYSVQTSRAGVAGGLWALSSRQVPSRSAEAYNLLAAEQVYFDQIDGLFQELGLNKELTQEVCYGGPPGLGPPCHVLPATLGRTHWLAARL